MIAAVPHTPASITCPGLTVIFHPAPAGVVPVDEADEIRICVPERNAVARQATMGSKREPRDLPIRAPEICVVPPTRGCAIEPTVPGAITVIALDRRFCDREAVRQYGGRFRITDYFVAQDPFVRRIGHALSAGLRVENRPDDAFLEGLARDLARHVAFTYGRTNHGARSKGMSPARLERVLARIDEGLKGPLPLSELAAEAFMSEFHFSRMFRYSTGYSPHTYVTLRRMDRAKELLTTTDHPLSEVAQEVGYKTQAHFTSVFRSYCGITPAVYRRTRGAHARSAGGTPTGEGVST